ncbi:MAG: choice-of-anchor W domain-containing protein [Thermoanaerobaculia bacterium]|nr:choice-of-anchor W domain-containing protein [Thermoanaerobaculia bacterium]
MGKSWNASFRLLVISLIWALAIASRAVAAISTSHLPDEAAADAIVAANGGAYRFATEARIGRAGDWELGLRRHPSILNDGTLRTANFDHWPNGQPIEWTVTYTASSRQLSTRLRFAASTSVISWSSTQLVGDFNELFVRTRAATANSSIRVQNLVLDGVPVDDSSVSVNTGGDARDVLRIRGAELADGFTLTATVTMAWTGAKPRNSALDAQVWGAHVVEIPSDTTPPGVTFTAPTSGSLLNAETLLEPVTAVWSDADSGLDLTSFRLLVDGVDKSAEATATAAGLSWVPTLADGAHLLELSIRDQAGNLGSATLNVSSDATPPLVSVLAPIANSLSNERQPTIVVEYSDAGSGISLERYYFSVDGNGWSGRVTPGPAGFSYTIPVENAFSYGGHFVAVEIYDQAGNRKYKVVEWDVDPDAAIVRAFDPLPGSRLLVKPPFVISGGWQDRGATSTPPENVRTILDGQPIPCEVSPGSFRCEVSDPADGPHHFRLEVIDPAGNFSFGETHFELEVDREPPVLVLDTPPDGFLTQEEFVVFSGRVSDDTGVTRLSLAGDEVSIAADGSFSFVHPHPVLPTIPVSGSTLSMTAEDGVGQRVSIRRSFQVDRYPPDLEIYEPVADGRPVNAPTIRVRGRGADVSRIDRVEVNGVLATITGQTFEAVVSLTAGQNALPVRVFDGAQNVTERTLHFNRVDLPSLSVTWPAEGERLAVETIEIRGTVAENAAVRVNDRPATVTGTSWVLPDLALAPGGNSIRVEASAPGTGVATAVVHVVRDLEPPHLAVTTPSADSTVFTDHVWVSGLVNDVVPGTVHAGNTVVTVAGVVATVGNRSFAARVPLALGENELAVEALDAAGNRGSTTVTVTRALPAGKRLEIVSGDRQTGSIGGALSLPLRVRALDVSGAPAAGVRIVFRVQGSDGALDGDRRAVVVVTAADGTAETSGRLGTRSGVAVQRVTASAVGFGESVTFLFDVEPGPPELLVIDAGNQQTGVTGRLLPRPLAVALVDAGANRLPDVPVTFRVTSGGATFADGTTERTIATDNDGRASVQLVLGPDEKLAGNTVDVFLAGTDPDAPGALVVGFTANGRAAGPVAETTISGIVLDNQDEPVPGARLWLAGTSLETTTGPDGRFLLTGAPAGERKLHVDGSTVTRPGTWPPLEFDLAVIPGRENTVGMPIFLLPLDLEHGVLVDDATGGTLTLPEVPGFALEIAPGSVTFPDGSRSGLVSVTPVHSDKVPMTPNFGQQPRLIVTIQPANAHFDPPARMTLPNVEGLAPGQVTEMYSFDHDLGSFVSIGPATVSEDGQTITSNPGVGILKAGWHCGGNPGESGTVHDCPPCTICNGRRCVPGCELPQTVTSGGLEAALFSTCACEEKACEINQTCSGSGCVGEKLFVRGVEITGDAFTAPIPIVGVAMTFEARAVSTNCPTVTFDWDFGDGTTGSGATVQHTYRRKGMQAIVVTATCADSCARDEEKLDVSAVALKLKELTYSGATYNTVLEDTGTPYEAPHWQDNSSPLDGDGSDENGDRSFPVTFVRDSQVEVEAKFLTDPPTIFPADQKPKVRTQGELNSLAETELRPAGADLRLDKAPLEDRLPNAVDFLNPLRLPWEVTSAKGTEWTSAGTSENRVYVTLGAPANPGKLYESVLDIACRNGQGAISPLGLVGQIWTDFSTPETGVLRKAVDGHNKQDAGGETTSTDGLPGEMLYWVEAGDRRESRVRELCQSVEAMLDPRATQGDLRNIGTCMAWTDLFVATLEANGLRGYSSREIISKWRNPVQVAGARNGSAKILVKRWSLVTANTSTCPDPRYRIGYGDGEYEDEQGVGAQGRENPGAKFWNHFIVVGDNVVYDPSYGAGPYAGSSPEAALQAWEIASLSGYEVICTPADDVHSVIPVTPNASGVIFVAGGSP